MVEPWQVGVPTWPRSSTKVATTEGWRKNELIFGTIRLIRDTFAQGKIEVLKGTAPQQNHGLIQLLAKPRPRCSPFDLWEQLIIDWYLTGNHFWEKVRDRTGRVRRLWRLDPHFVRIVPEPENIVGGYIYDVGGMPYPILRDDVVHFKSFDPDDRYFGLSPIIATLRALATDNEMTDVTKSMMENYAIPPTVVTMNEVIYDEPTIDKMRRKWNERFGRGSRGDGPAFLAKGMTATRLGLTMDELAMPELRGIQETRVLMGLGGAPLVYLLGTYAGMKRAIYNNYSEARAALTEEIVGPLWNRFDDQITTELLPEWPGSDGLEAKFNLEDVPAEQQRRLDRMKAATDAFTKGVLDVNEARAFGGYAPFKRNFRVVPTLVEVIELDQQGNAITPTLPASTSTTGADPAAADDQIMEPKAKAKASDAPAAAS